MHRIDLPVNTLDDLFDDMEVREELPSGHPLKNAPRSDAYCFFKWADTSRRLYIEVLPKPEVREAIHRYCCAGPVAAVMPEEQRYSAVPGEYALMATDTTGIPDIRVCLLPASALVFKGVLLVLKDGDVLAGDAPLNAGKIGNV